MEMLIFPRYKFGGARPWFKKSLTIGRAPTETRSRSGQSVGAQYKMVGNRGEAQRMRGTYFLYKVHARNTVVDPFTFNGQRHLSCSENGSGCHN